MTKIVFNKHDFYKLNWAEYGEELESLYIKINSYLKLKNVSIDAVVPILRGGAVAGTFFAYKFNVLKILPVQCKYLNNKIINLIDLRKDSFNLKNEATILVVENNHCTGTTAKTTISTIKKACSTSKIVYSAVHMDYSYQEIPQVEAVFYSKLTNETKKIPDKEAKTKNVITKICVFPWESFEEEWAMANEQPYNYNGV